MTSVSEHPTKKKKYRRKKIIIHHANPLFEEWLLEWEREAAKCGSNMKYNYRKARHSLKLYPLPVYKGKDCLVLAHFGDKICSMLDRRLEKHMQENGPIEWDEVHKIKKTPVKKKRVRKKSENKKEPTLVKDGTLSSNSSFSCEVLQSGGHRGRAYVPSYRSGAYALLVALYYKSLERNSPGFMKKADLIEAAQHHSNASFMHSADGSHYTAWSSMSTLVKKKLVTREGNPSRYSLTAEGNALAARLLCATNPTMQLESCSPVKTSTVSNSEEAITLSSRSCSLINLDNSPVKRNRPSGTTCISVIDTNSLPTILENLKSDEIKFKKNWSNSPVKASSSSGTSCTSVVDSRNTPAILEALKSEAVINVPIKAPKKGNTNLLNQPTVSSNNSGSVVFSYVSNLEMETPLKNRAVVCIDDDGFEGFLIKCRLSALLDSNLPYRLDDTRTAPIGYTYAYISNESAPDMSPGLLSPTQKDLVSTLRKTNFANKIPFDSDAPHLKESVCTVPREILFKSSSSSSSLMNFTKADVQRSSSSAQVLKSSSSASSSSAVSQFILTPENYDIVLCVDNCEAKGGFSGCKPSTRDIIIAELNRHKIMFDVRKLHVGDFLWVIQERSSIRINNSQPKELVLPYIIERKRMDDLASSIKDGRFREQKFRLKQSGLSKPIYLVEEFGSQYASLPEGTCLQAVTNTQVVDGFTVKITKDQQESAAFLTIMTRCLQSRYRGRSVTSISIDELQSQPSESFNYEVETELVTFGELNRASMKNQQLSVKDMFAKHLLQLHGVSVEKAKAIVEKFGNPASLIAAYEELGDPAKCAQLLASLKYGKTGRQIGPTLSTHISKLYANVILK